MIKKTIYLLISLILLVQFTGCAKNGIHDIKYSGKYKGHKYKGNFRKDRRNGYGVYTWPSGVYYKGYWYRGKRSGKGLQVWPKKNKYGYAYFSGKFRYSKPTGVGKFVNKWGTKYNAHWNGWDISSYYKSTATFKDKIIKGKFKGKIPYSMSMPNKVEVEFLKEKSINYKGKKITVPKHSKFIGHVDKYYNPTGHGKLIFSDGKNIYEGDFKKAKTIKHYYTKKYSKKLAQEKRNIQYKNQKCKTYTKWIYLGDKCNENNKAHGYGKAISMNGRSKFVGEFKNGIFLKGTYISGNTKYIGDFNDYGLNGYCEYYVNNKPIYKGNYTNAKKDGKGICYIKDIPEACEYKNNKRIDSIYLYRVELKKLKEEMAQQKAQMKKEQRRLRAEEKRRRRAEENNNYRRNSSRSSSSSNWGNVLMKSMQQAGDEIIAQKRRNYAQIRRIQQSNDRYKREQKEKRYKSNQRLVYKQNQIKRNYERNQRIRKERLRLLEEKRQRIQRENKYKLEQLRQQELRQQQVRQRKQKLAQEKETKRINEKKYLQRLANGTRLAGKRCYGDNYVGGQLPSIRPRVVGCVDVYYSAYCPSNSYSAYDGVLKNMLSNSGGCFGDISKVTRDLGCKAKDYIVKVKEITPCQ